MPIYEYVCGDCREEFETLRSMNQADVDIACFFCRGDHTKRKPSVCYSEVVERQLLEAHLHPVDLVPAKIVPTAVTNNTLED